MTLGREAFWRQIVIAELASYQRKTGADPTAEEIFAAAYPRFCRETETVERNAERGERVTPAALAMVPMPPIFPAQGTFGFALRRFCTGDKLREIR